MASGRTLLRAGSGTVPPLAMLPGELAYTPDDGLLWLGGFGDGAPVRAAGVTMSEVDAEIAANAPGFQNAAQVNAAIAAALAGITLDGGTF